MTDKNTTPILSVAKKKDLDLVLKLVRAFHKAEGIDVSNSTLTNTVYPLLKKQNEHGCVLLINLGTDVIGYVALCFGYSIEFGGRDASIDELYLKNEYQGKKIARSVLADCKSLANGLGLQALHINVSSSASKLRSLYEDCGFSVRAPYATMSAQLGAKT